VKRALFGVTPLLWLVLLLTIWNGIRLWTAIAWHNILNEFAARPGPVYIAVSGAFWFTIGLFVFWSLWQGKIWTKKLLLGAAAGYTVWYWSDRLYFQTNRANWPFIVVLNIILLAYVFIVTRSNFFQREAYEQESEND